jgi:hypothetical protein
MVPFNLHALVTGMHGKRPFVRHLDVFFAGLDAEEGALPSRSAARRTRGCASGLVVHADQHEAPQFAPHTPAERAALVAGLPAAFDRHRRRAARLTFGRSRSRIGPSLRMSA